MYNKISFKENSDYFSHSSIFNDLKQHLSPENTTLRGKWYLEMVENPEEKINLTVQLFMETIIKHNLSSDIIERGRGGIDPLRFFSEENSKEVFDAFNPVINPPKRDRMAPPPTREQQELERAKENLYDGIVDGMKAYILDQKYLENIDVCENMKQEFGTFMENTSRNTPGIKKKL